MDTLRSPGLFLPRCTAVMIQSVMKSEVLCGLIFLAVITGSESAVRPLTVKRGDTAVLPCTERCSGVVRWTVFHKPKDPLVQCNQTGCRSVKEGYQMIHNQYLQGNLSLIIPGADYSKRARYTCDCDGRDRCDVNLRIEAVNTSYTIQPGQSLLLDLDVSEPMEVIYNSTGEAGRSSGQICTVDGRSVQCNPEYSPRTSVLSAVELRGMKESDSGVYTVRDSRNEEDIHTYTVTVKDGGDGSEALGQVHKLRNRRSAVSECPTCECPERSEAGVPVWVVVLLVVLLGAVIAVGAVVNMRLKRENKKLQDGAQHTEAQLIQKGDQSNGHTSSTEHHKLTSLNISGQCVSVHV